MKLFIEQSLDCQEPEIRIICGLMDERLKRLIEQIKLYAFSIMAEKDGITTPIALDDIFYFEAVDNKVFLYTSQEVYRCSQKLYELETLLADTPFVRIAKSTILNTTVVQSVRAQFSGRLEATLLNGEKLIISKHYLQAFRQKFIS